MLQNLTLGLLIGVIAGPIIYLVSGNATIAIVACVIGAVVAANRP